MTLLGAEALLLYSPEDIEEFEKIYMARANLKREGQELYDVLSPERQELYFEWKKERERRILLQQDSTPVIYSITESLRKSADGERADSSSSREKKKKKKRCVMM